MWRSKRVIFAGLLAIAVLVGSMAAVAIAQGDDQGSAKTLVSRVATILGIEDQKVQDAFDQARQEMQEEALDMRLQRAVEQDRMTHAEADEYKEWWQARPECEQLNQWRQARPDTQLRARHFWRVGGKALRGGPNGHWAPAHAAPTSVP